MIVKTSKPTFGAEKLEACQRWCAAADGVAFLRCGGLEKVSGTAETPTFSAWTTAGILAPIRMANAARKLVGGLDILPSILGALIATAMSRIRAILSAVTQTACEPLHSA